MRTSVLLVMILFLSAPLRAQSVSTEAPPTVAPVQPCRPFDSPPRVVVTMREGKSLHGTLLCMGEEVELATNGQLLRTPLTDVKKIAEPRDPVWNGAAIGAAIGVLTWTFCGGNCDNSAMARVTAYYALLGLAIDASMSNNKTIYSANRRSPTVTFRVHF